MYIKNIAIPMESLIATYCSLITTFERKKPNNNDFINLVFIRMNQSTSSNVYKEIIAMILSIHGFTVIRETNKICSIERWKSNVLNNLNNKKFVEFVEEKLIKIFEKMVDILND